MIRNRIVKNKFVCREPLQENGWNREKNTGEFEKGRRLPISQEIISLINEAKNVVCITTFLIAHKELIEAIKEAVARDVRVYLLTASENTLEKNYDYEGDFSRKCIDSHIMLLYELSRKIFIRSSKSNHAKFILIDPFADDAKGIISTGNFTEEGIGGRNEEMAHSLNKDEISILANYFKHAFWNCAEHEMRFDKFIPADKIGVPVDLSTDANQSVVTSLDGNRSLHDACMNLVKSASKSLVVTAFGFDENNDVVKEIIKKARNGVKVSILCRIRPKNKNAVIALRNAGAIVYGFQYLHAKCIIADNSKAMIMTANFEDLSFNKSFEVGAYITSKKGVDDILSNLRDWIEKSGWQLYLNASLKDLKGYFIELNISNCDEKYKKEIVPFKLFNCGVHSPSIELIQNFEPKEKIKEIELSLSDKYICCEIDYTWGIDPPCLASGSYEIWKTAGKKSLANVFLAPKESYHPKLFIEPSRRRVVAIRDDSELNDAIELKKKMKCEAIVYEK